MLNSPSDELATHPTDDQLQSVVNGHELNVTEMEFVEWHLSTCHQCQATAGRLHTDSLVQLIQKASVQRTRNAPKISAGYELIHEIGRGASGIVYRARQSGTNRLVAVKMLVAGVKSNRADLARFNREANALSRLDHPNVVKVFEVGEQDGTPFLAMEWIDGPTLSKYLKENSVGYVPLAKLVSQLACGVEHVHRQGILHRDLKPQNVLIPVAPEADAAAASNLKTERKRKHLTRPEMNFESAKICDFGLARLAADEGFHTRTGETLGTPAYMAPEQIGAGAELITARTDVYGLGAILYECLTGRPPFHGNSPVDTLKMVLEREPVAISELRPNVPRDLEVICHRCLAKNPKDRFQTALELQQDLERFVQNRPIVSRPVSMFERTIRWARRNPWPVTFAALFSLAAMTIIISQLNHSRQIANQRDEAVGQYQAARAAIWEMLNIATSESDVEIPRLQQLETDQAATALALFESLAKKEGTSDSLLDLGKIQMQYGSGLVSQGKTDEGLEQFQRSQATFQKLFELSSDDLETIHGLVASQVKLGYALDQNGRTVKAIELVRATLPLAQKLYRQTPKDVANANLLAQAHHNLGAFLVNVAKHELAIEQFELAVAIRQQARQLADDDDELLRFMAESQISLAVCQMAMGASEVGETYLEAIKSFNEILERKPDNINAMDSKGVAFLNYSNVLAGKGDANGAIDACTQGIVSIEKSLAANPDQHNAKNYVSMLYGNRAVFRSQIRQTDDAISDWQRAIEFSVMESTETFCRHALIRDLLVNSNIDDAISEIEKFEFPSDNGDSQFQLATSWCAICNSIAVNKNEAAPDAELRCFLEAKKILQRLGNNGYFRDNPAAQQKLLEGEDFRSFRLQAGNENIHRILSAAN